MEEKMLISAYRYDNIGKKFIKNKSQKSCVKLPYYQKESSNKSAFQLQLLLLVSYFGQMFHKYKKQSVLQSKEFVCQDIHIGQNAGQDKIRDQKSSASAIYNHSKDLLFDKVNDLKAKISGFLFDIWQDKRLRWGLILLLIISPFTRIVYNIFPEDGFGEFIFESSYLTIPNFIEIESWYWFSIHYWVYGMSELVAPLCAMFGIFLLFPKKYYPSYLVGIPFGYFLSLLIHKISVTSNEELHQGYGMAIVAMFIILGVVVFIVSDKILFKKNHIIRASEARMVGLIKMPGMSWGDKEILLKKEAESWTKEQNELYDQSRDNSESRLIEVRPHMKAS